MDMNKIINSECDLQFLDHLDNALLAKHCINAMVMSYWKYGHVCKYVADISIMNIQSSIKAFDKDGNHEHIVDIINYCMVRQMFYRNEDRKMLELALSYSRIYDENKYKPTDSSSSTKVYTVRELMYSHLSCDGKAPRDMKY